MDEKYEDECMRNVDCCESYETASESSFTDESDDCGESHFYASSFVEHCVSINDTLNREINVVNDIFGVLSIEDCATMSNTIIFNEGTIQVQIDISFLSETTRKSWDINDNGLLFANIVVDTENYYKSETVPKVQFFVRENMPMCDNLNQSDIVKYPPICSQMDNIIALFLEENKNSFASIPDSCALMSKLEHQHDIFTCFCKMQFSANHAILKQTLQLVQFNIVTAWKTLLLMCSGDDTDSSQSTVVSQGETETTCYDDLLALRQLPRCMLSVGFLPMLLCYVRIRLLNLSSFCVICDQPHIFQGGYLPAKALVCNRDLCNFAYRNLGIMSKVADGLYQEPQITDLLVEFAREACFSARAGLIFKPFPLLSEGINKHVTTNGDQSMHPLQGHWCKDISKIRSLFNKLPSFSTFCVNNSCDSYCSNFSDSMVRQLYQWILSSNSCYFVFLKDKPLKFMKTPHQFLMVSAAPSKEKLFQQQKRIHGSCFAFHGSPFDNWHSILHYGLVIASGTKLQTHGAAHGKGIYLSPRLSVSLGYSGLFGGSPAKKTTTDESASLSSCYLPKSRKMAVAVCEIICSPALKKGDGTRNIWVCQNPDHVVTRFLCIYTSNCEINSTVDTTSHNLDLTIALNNAK